MFDKRLRARENASETLKNLTALSRMDRMQSPISKEASNVVSIEHYRPDQEDEFGELVLPDGTVISAQARWEIARAMVEETAIEVRARIAARER